MGSFYVISAILIWSSLGLFVRLIKLPVHEIIFYSALSSIFFTALLIFIQGYKKILPSWKALGLLCIAGPINLLNIFTFYYAYRNTSIANSVLSHYIAPILVAFMAAVFLKEKMTRTVISAILVASVGLWIMVGGATGINPSQSSGTGFFQDLSPDTIGILSGLLSGLAYAVLVIAFRVFSQNYHPLAQNLVLNSVISLILLPFISHVPFAGTSAGIGAETVFWLVLMGVVQSTLAPVLYLKGLSTVAANRAAVLGYLEPVGAIVFSMIFLKEFPQMRSIAGGGLILLAGYLTLKGK